MAHRARRWLAPAIAAAIATGAGCTGIAQQVSFPTNDELAVFQMTFIPSKVPAGVLSAQAALQDLIRNGYFVHYPSKTYKEQFGYWYPVGHVPAGVIGTPAWEVMFLCGTDRCEVDFVDARAGNLLDAILHAFAKNG